MNKLRLLFLAIPLTFIFNINVNAQSVGMLEEVVVTAQKREESLQDTPIAITAITESTIDDLDIANVVDLAGMAPNVHIINTPSNNTAATVAMRGGVTINPAIITTLLRRLTPETLRSTVDISILIGTDILWVVGTNYHWYIVYLKVLLERD